MRRCRREALTVVAAGAGDTGEEAGDGRRGTMKREHQPAWMSSGSRSARNNGQLVVEPPLLKIYELVSWDDEIPNIYI